MARLGDFTSPDVGEGRILVVPLGSTEQHGPHLPLDTDTVIATAVAERAAASVPAVVVAPPVAIGASGEHAGFAGTLSIGSEVLASVIVEIVRTAGPEFARVVLVNGHGGNLDAVRSAAATCAYEGRPVGVWHARLAAADAHAGSAETSVMLALQPERVRLDRAEFGATEPMNELLDAMRSGGVAAVSPNGILGDPTTATPEAGEVILAGWVDELVAVLES